MITRTVTWPNKGTQDLTNERETETGSINT